jgi:fatty acid desaturase
MTANALDPATRGEASDVTQRKVGAIFTRDELRMLNERSDAMGFAAVGFAWAVILATAVALVWAASQPAAIAVPTFVLGFVVLGGRHLALAVLHHEAAHRSLFKTPWLNEIVGDWACARPSWNDLKKYRVHHFIHHRKTSQPEDTDRSLVEPFPTTRASLVRKLARDLFGLTGLKYLFGRLLMDAGVLKWTVASDVVRLPQRGRRWWSYPLEVFRNAGGMLLVNGLLLTACWASGHTWLYAVWVLSYVTPYPLFVRIRSLAEHACTETTTDMFLNTRTTRAGLLARATVAPVRVNYHVEHHVLPGVAYYRLPLMHRMLRERGVVGQPPGYLDVLRVVSSRRAPVVA